MQHAIEKANVLIEALGWIRQFRDKIIVIKLGGSVMENADALRHLLLDIVFMETVGMRPVVVHGGGAAISLAMESAGIKPRFIQGRRVTDDATRDIVEQVLIREISEHLVERIEQFGGRAQPLNFRTTNVLFGKPIELFDEKGKAIDMGLVGHVTRVDRATIENLCYAGQVPVIPSMCMEESGNESGNENSNAPGGRKLNVNGDTAAMAVAQALGAEKLVFLSDVNGVREDKDDSDSLIHTLTADCAKEMIVAGSIDQGMIPKVEACLETLDKGVRKIHIIDGRLRHSLLLEIYTNKGVGTVIFKHEVNPTA